MFSRNNIPFVLLGILSLMAACDSTTSPANPLSDSAVITDVIVTPSLLRFTPEENGYKDTTITITITAEIDLAETSETPFYAVRNNNTNSTLISDSLTQSGNQFTASFDVSTTTTSFANYIIELFVFDEQAQESYYQTVLRIEGFSNNPPVILEISGPNEIIRPEGNAEIPATFIAKVTDADGQDTINQVFIRIVDRSTGEVTGSPFEMFNDGATLGDVTANDSLWTWSLPVTATNTRPDRDYDISFFATDLGGLSSDTLDTRFRIRD